MSDYDEDITRNYHGGDPFSDEAHDSLGNLKLIGQSRILRWIRQNGPATCDELEQSLEMSHQTCSARISELRKAGALVELGRAMTRSGRTARVHALAPPKPGPTDTVDLFTKGVQP